MSETKIYVSGPISGKENGNVAAFELGRDWVTEYMSCEAVVPYDQVVEEHVGICPDGRTGGAASAHREACYLRADYKALVECQGILMLPGWRSSWGAKHELMIACDIGLRIWMWTVEGPVEAM